MQSVAALSAYSQDKKIVKNERFDVVDYRERALTGLFI